MSIEYGVHVVGTGLSKLMELRVAPLERKMACGPKGQKILSYSIVIRLDGFYGFFF